MKFVGTTFKDYVIDFIGFSIIAFPNLIYIWNIYVQILNITPFLEIQIILQVFLRDIAIFWHIPFLLLLIKFQYVWRNILRIIYPCVKFFTESFSIQKFLSWDEQGNNVTPDSSPPIPETRKRAIDILDRILAHVQGRTMLGELIIKNPKSDAPPKKIAASQSGEICEPVKGVYSDFDVVTQKDAFRVLISTVLSVRNRDEATLVATEALFSTLPTPVAIRDAPREQVEQLIRKSGMYKIKAKRVQDIARIILKEYGGVVPRDIETLMTLPGVGRKVANCVMVYAYAEPAIPVDTHVHRIANRTGLVTTKKPEQTEESLIELYPRDRWCDVNEAFVLHGQQTCKPIGPLCSQCPVATLCDKRIKVPTKKHKKSRKEAKTEQ